MNTITETMTRSSRSAGPALQALEDTNARVSPAIFLWAAGGSILGSLTLKALGRSQDALFVGQWAPTFLLLGIFSKLDRTFGPQ